LLLIASEVKDLPADIMISPDLTKTSFSEIYGDLKQKTEKIKTTLNQIKNSNNIEFINEEMISTYLAAKGTIDNIEVTMIPKKES
jgi:hypothetical protein